MNKKKKLFSIILDLPYGQTNPYDLFDASKNSKELVQKLQLQKKIPVHNGCVNSISWSDNGKFLLSGSDDQHLSIVKSYDYSVVAHIRTGHRANIFSAKFLPNSGDSRVISSSGDGIIMYSDIERPETSLNNKFTCHRGTAYEIMTVPNDPNSFLSCGEDRTVRWFDIRTKTSCANYDCKEDVLIFCRAPVTSIAVNPLIPYQLAIGCADSSVQIFDRRMLSTQSSAGCLSNGFHALASYFTVPGFPPSRRITSLCYSSDGREMLVSYSSDYIYLFDIKDDMGKKPKILSSSDSGPYNRNRPLMKRLRVRGDWSDTGPNSRPDNESEANRDNSPNNLVRRMTDILTRMLFTSNRTRAALSASHSSSESSPLASSHSEDGDVEATADANSDETAVRNISYGDQVNQPDASEPMAPQAEERDENSSNSDLSNEPVVRLTTDHNSALVVCPCCSQTVEPNPISHDSHPRTSETEIACESTTVIKNSCVSASESRVAEPALSASNLSVSLQKKSLIDNTVIEKSSSQSEVPANVENVSTVVLQQFTDNLEFAESSAHSSSEIKLSEENTLAETSDAANTTLERSSESETEAAVQSIQPSESVPSVNELRSTRSPTPEVLEENDEVELMMEVDSWESESEDNSQARNSLSNRINRRRIRASPSGDDNDIDQKDEVKREKPPKNTAKPTVKKMYKGHRNARTMIKESTFWGDNFVMSGSDCGHIFIWDRHTTELVMIMEADHHVVNCLQPHPFDPILASSGIDYDIKIWAPLREEPFFDLEKANEIVKRNEIMLEVTKDTITVPASFMFNMFNTLNHLRNGHRNVRWSRAGQPSTSASTNR